MAEIDSFDSIVAGIVVQAGDGVKINKLKVPKLIKHGSPSVILDCDFTLEDSDEEPVVKWFFNNDRTLVYQWIPGEFILFLRILVIGCEPLGGHACARAQYETFFYVRLLNNFLPM